MIWYPQWSQGGGNQGSDWEGEQVRRGLAFVLSCVPVFRSWKWWLTHSATKGNIHDDYEALLSNEMEAAAPLKLLSVCITSVCTCNKAILIVEKQSMNMEMSTRASGDMGTLRLGTRVGSVMWELLCDSIAAFSCIATVVAILGDWCDTLGWAEWKLRKWVQLPCLTYRLQCLIKTCRAPDGAKNQRILCCFMLAPAAQCLFFAWHQLFGLAEHF